MKGIMLLIMFFSVNLLFSQQINVEGSILIGDHSVKKPLPGTIRWNGMDFEGWNGEEWVSLTNGMTAPIEDVDGNSYSTKRIGSQIWMIENLRTSKYADGSPIQNVPNPVTWSSLNTGAFTWYLNDSISNDITFGKLYNWYAVDDPRGLCPTGWHVPTDGEWMILEEFLLGQNVAGGKMKVYGQFWNPPNTGASNESGFTALPAGLRNENGAYGTYLDRGIWWSATKVAEMSPVSYSYYVTSSSASLVNSISYSQPAGLSIRCVKN